MQLAEHKRDKPQRLLGCNIISLSAVENALKDHYLATPLWGDTPSDDELRKIILKEITRLTSPKQARVMRLRWFGEQFAHGITRYGYRRNCHAVTSRGLMAWAEVARRLKVSRQNLWKIELRAMAALRQSEKLADYLTEKRTHAYAADLN